MILSKGYAAQSPADQLKPFVFERAEAGNNDVLIQILYCGICHADIHQSKNEYDATIYPLVPGHEIIGRVKSIGDQVKNLKIGELVGVGYFIGSCQHCSSCLENEEQFCENGILPTQNGRLPGGETTKGGYSDSIVVNKDYVLKVSEKLDAAGVAPLLCAGITTYSALRHFNPGKGHQIAVLGLGGLGHLAVKFAVSFGAEVTVLSTSADKQESALALGAHHFINTSADGSLAKTGQKFDLLIDTVSVQHDYNQYLNLLKKDGTMILLGVPPEAPRLSAYALISRRRKLTGSFIGGIKETQEMLDYCAAHNITAAIELIRPEYINQAFERVLSGDVHYRFVIDMTAL